MCKNLHSQHEMDADCTLVCIKTTDSYEPTMKVHHFGLAHLGEDPQRAGMAREVVKS